MAPVRLVRRPPARIGSEALARIMAILPEQIDAIRGHEAGARRGTDPEDVHDMRTAARRLRAILRVVRSGFDRAWVEALRSELEWLGTTLGAVRDLDVLREHLRDELAALEDSTGRSASLQLSECLDLEHSRAKAKLLGALDSRRYRELLSRLDEAVRQPRVVTAELSLPRIAARQFKKLRKAVKALPAEPADEELHAVRIKVKRARYAAELAEEVIGRPAARFVDRAKKVQDILGEHQDAVMAESRIRACLRGVRSRPATWLRDRLIERQRARREKARKAFWKRWPRLKRRGRKAWT
ncbi:MAG TPA: CHAD domain-containing protein [Methylomirabilota bacterium]